ncbi:unnamed protein product [Clonostachys rhizophaga]|uniref:protein-ribulosamine 3-kinase n=1 Tax=Clonostachys rhizophaga TaxID=160324 RepID=A0A9N9W3N3_9HYPO|nr:unnamed protein product [Clonostachys rhizophaga]
MSSFFVQGVDPFGDNVTLDQGIMSALPPGARIISTSRAGQSLWVETVRIEAMLPDGSTKAYFKKGATGNVGREMVRGCYESEKALHSFIPEYVPEPIVWGSYVSRDDMHFYLAEYVEMDDVHPDAKAWATVASTLHRRSMGKSPEGKFGFHVGGFMANVPMSNSWSSSWESFWAQRMRSLLEIEEARCGKDASFTGLKSALLERVIPRYLRPLESDGRSVQPCLLHADLWPGNIKPRTDSPDILCAFDSASFWGHFEVDLVDTGPGLWNLEKAGEAYREMVGVSEPQDEYLDRNSLYGIGGMILRSAMYNQDPKRRSM